MASAVSSLSVWACALAARNADVLGAKQVGTLDESVKVVNIHHEIHCHGQCMPKVQVKNGRLSAACPAARRPLAVNPLPRTIECGNLAGFKRNSRDEAIGRGCGHVEKARARQKSSAMSRSGKAAARRCHTWVTTYPAGDITARAMKWTRFCASKTDAAGVIMTEMMTSKRSFAEKKTTAIPTQLGQIASHLQRWR